MQIHNVTVTLTEEDAQNINELIAKLMEAANAEGWKEGYNEGLQDGQVAATFDWAMPNNAGR